MSAPWQDRVRYARRAGAFDAYDEADAAEWDQCAVGEALEARGLDALEAGITAFEVPKEARRLKALGMRFTRAVRHNDFGRAQSLLWQIESEVEEVAAQVYAEPIE
jgi:hypothetical protein